MLTLPGYKILEQIQVGVDTIIYRGQSESEHKSVIIKVLQTDYPSVSQITRLTHEYQVLQRLDFTGIVKPYTLIKYHNSLALVLEDFGGQSLHKFLTCKTLALSGFLPIAIQLAATLEEVHKNQIIHKDINPHNIIINPETGQVKIADFSIASRLNKENQTISNPNLLEGTLAYISPEQTGRMNRAIDYRTDFYSLGVTFYEMLTGCLPFQATDPMELVHCHIAKQPLPPKALNPEIPEAVSDIVLKLLAKTAESRYQSAKGLRVDLEACLTQLQNTGKIEDFIPGQQDLFGQFQIPQKLYGREAEVTTLISAFERVSLGTTEMMLVSGYSGIGKSSLVQEVHKPIVRQRGYFISGKFDQFKRNIPYASLIQAFQDLIRQLLTESDEKIAIWKSKLLDAFGQQGRVIINVIPEVELIVGQQPEMPQLGPTESQNRFNRVFRQFIRVFTKKSHPLVLFLDDLQWADSASLKLIELLMSEPDSQYLLMIGAYRDNEVGVTHPLMLTLDEIQKNGARVNQITLHPLNFAHVNQLITDTLCTETHPQVEPWERRSKPLASLLLEKTAGNPFFLTQLLQFLTCENLLSFDFDTSRWQWEIEQIQGIGITDNVVELMVSKLQKLSDVTQNVLKLAACIGNQFNLEVLSIVNEKSLSVTAEQLWEALQVGLILPMSNSYRIPLVYEPGFPVELTGDELVVYYKFLHDRVQQATYSLIPELQKKEVHLKIGKLLLENTQPHNLAENIFDIVNHLNIGAELLTRQMEKYELSKLNFFAGKKAKVSTAYTSALKYITLGIDSLPGDIWNEHYDLAFSLYKERSECEYLCSNFEQAEEVIDILLNQAKTNLEKAEIYTIQMVMYSNLNKYADSIKLGLSGLKLFEVNLPETSEQWQAAISVELSEVQSNLKDKKIAALIHLSQMACPDKKACMSLLMNLEGSAYHTNPALLSWITLKMVNLSLTYGNTDLSSLAYVMYGAMLGSELGDYKSGYEFGLMALELNDKFNAFALVSKINLIFCEGINPWSKHIKSSFPFLNKAYQFGLESGDLLYAGFAFAQLIGVRVIKGDDLSSIYEESEKGLSFYRQTKNETYIFTAMLWQYMCLFLGFAPEKCTLTNELFDENQHLEKLTKNGSHFAITWYYLIKLQSFFIYESYAEAIKMAIGLKTIATIPGDLSIAECCFYYSLTTAALYSVVTTEEQKIYWETLEKNQERMKKWADNCPENFLHKYLLVAAEMARISGKELEAMKLYDQAIKSAQENEYTQNAAIGNELAAKFYLARGFDTIAKTYMMSARYGYAKWGATAKVKDLESRYPQLLSRTPARETTGIEGTRITTSTITGGSAAALDLVTVIKASQAIASEIVLNKLLDKLMNMLIENAGAQKGLLLLEKEGKWVLAAEGYVERDNCIVLPSINIETHSELPIGIINYVERTQETVVLNDATQLGLFTNDPYIVNTQPSSILCLPIIYQGKLTGILYLENNLTTGAFTLERVEVLKLLSSQASISIENASLYRNLEHKVEERTWALREKNEQLEQTLQQLKTIQTQIIAQEKLASLGALTAGIAHEISNPLNFVNNFAELSVDLTQELLAEIETQTERLDATAVDYIKCILNDLAQNAEKINKHGKRADSIVRGMLMHSSGAGGRRESTDINALLAESIQLAYHGMRTKYADFNITIQTDYDDNIGLVDIVPQDMSRVFLNVINNACYAANEHKQKLGEEFNPRLSVSTKNLSDTAEIFIRDNGPGIPQDILDNIFNPFFTTKPTGVGTGLGLSISHDIIVQQHQGSIQVETEPGAYTEFIIRLPKQGFESERSQERGVSCQES